MTRENIQNLTNDIQEFYTKTWSDWYNGTNMEKAKIIIKQNSIEYPYYDSKTDEIHIPITDGDLMDYPLGQTIFNYNERIYKIWKQQLIHEMIHEYEYKIIKHASEEGKKLRINHKPVFDPPEKHTDMFYTAVADRASYFDRTPSDFLNLL